MPYDFATVLLCYPHILCHTQRSVSGYENITVSRAATKYIYVCMFGVCSQNARHKQNAPFPCQKLMNCLEQK